MARPQQNYKKRRRRSAAGAGPRGGQPCRGAERGRGCRRFVAGRSFDLPAQTLGAALLRFSEQAQVQVIVESRLAESVSAPPLKGAYTRGDALKVLLEGSGLTFRIVGTAAIAIHAVHLGADVREGVPAARPCRARCRRRHRGLLPAQRSAQCGAIRGRRVRAAGESGRNHRRRHPTPEPLRRRNTGADRSDPRSEAAAELGALRCRTAPAIQRARRSTPIARSGPMAPTTLTRQRCAASGPTRRWCS